LNSATAEGLLYVWSVQTDDEVHGASCSDRDDVENMRDWLLKHCPKLLMEGLMASKRCAVSYYA